MSRITKCHVRFRLHETPPDGALGAPKINLFRDLLLTPFRDPAFFGPGPPDWKKVTPEGEKGVPRGVTLSPGIRLKWTLSSNWGDKPQK